MKQSRRGIPAAALMARGFHQLEEECRQAAIKAAGGPIVRATDGEVIFDADAWKPTAEDLEWIATQDRPAEALRGAGGPRRRHDLVRS